MATSSDFYTESQPTDRDTSTSLRASNTGLTLFGTGPTKAQSGDLYSPTARGPTSQNMGMTDWTGDSEDENEGLETDSQNPNPSSSASNQPIFPQENVRTKKRNRISSNS